MDIRDTAVPQVRPATGESLTEWAELDEPAPDRRRRRYRIGKPWSWSQRAGGIVIVVVCVAAAVWYVPRVVNSDRTMLTGTVTSSGIVALTFPQAGQISDVKVHLNQQVRKGQVLATEYAPNVRSLLDADRAAIAAVQAKITELRANKAANPANAGADGAQIAAENAQMAMDNAQFATDRMRIAATEIVAPSSGVIVAVNGQPGENVTSSGIRDYTSASQQVASQQQPQFSLFPEGPQPVRHAAGSGSSLPVVALRVSSTWQVVVLIPEYSVQSIKPGRAVTIDVPSIGISGVPGRFEEVLPNPEMTSSGTMYQAIIAVTGKVSSTPLDGMTANVRLTS